MLSVLMCFWFHYNLCICYRDVDEVIRQSQISSGNFNVSVDNVVHSTPIPSTSKASE